MKRVAVFRESFEIRKETKILDLGSENGSNIASYLDGTDHSSANVYIADIDRAAVEEGSLRFGFTPALIDEAGTLDFPDRFFDIVFCSSVIEHTTIPKSEVWAVSDQEEFQRRSWERQTLVAKEISRLGKQYFVQTPSRSFPIESHSWLPLVGYLPRKQLVRALRISNRIWVKETYPDFNLLGKNEMRALFPDAEIRIEKAFGLEKSLIAVKRSGADIMEPN